VEVCADFSAAVPAGRGSFNQVFEVILNMSTREILSKEINTAPENLLKEVYDFLLFLKAKRMNSGENKVQTHIASEKVLSRDWDTPEEDEAWKDL
jgi:hypothetical protein